ncbi:MAG TPA: 30S ribosome-binding factor RbfA [Anaerolineae bacterium]|nr:30S ribosome-binding factor RbfA [Anaerolineae bacterium]
MPSLMRVKRIADRIKQDLSRMLVMGEIKDPRLANIYITDVNVDRELAFANVFVSAIEGSQRASEILQGLENARGFLRSVLANHIQLHSFPHLRFHWDPTPERADHIEEILNTIREEKEGKGND